MVIVEDVIDACQRINLAVAEVAGMRTVIHPLVADGRLGHDVLDVGERETQVTLAGYLHPQGEDARHGGRRHRGARHGVIGGQSIVHHGSVVAVHIVVDGRHDHLTGSADPGQLHTQWACSRHGIGREVGDVAQRVGTGLDAAHVGAYRDDVGVGRQRAGAHVVGAAHPIMTLGGQEIGEVAAAGTPHVDDRRARRGEELHGQRVVAVALLIITQRLQVAREEHQFGLVGGDVILVDIQDAAIIVAQAGNLGARTGGNDGRCGEDFAGVGIQHVHRAPHLGVAERAAPGIGQIAVIEISLACIGQVTATQDGTQRCCAAGGAADVEAATLGRVGSVGVVARGKHAEVVGMLVAEVFGNDVREITRAVVRAIEPTVTVAHNQRLALLGGIIGHQLERIAD